MRDMLKKLVGEQEIDIEEEYRICDTHEELSSLEVKLGDASSNKSMLQQLSRIGGINYKDNTRNVMRRVMTNGCMSQYNMNGQRGKKKFKDFSNLLLLIEKAVLNNFKNATASDVQTTMSVAFKQAPDRSGGGGRKENDSVPNNVEVLPETHN
ncbi:uncharacterized protein LOC130648402 isoform X2 [Hydractinia symbiolongicarpus]|uniref:uncharacterized protein LOC130648402 isoform X2 n=1 Tax=Hydractinia symbiolongicarpus TaxID=13093 RepID=UPI00254F8742|nr:uncharacterized protein LOC130648402 isoform X2 [Hydractinia symbiolongicarpus]